MTEYWVSQANKWCDFCKIFISHNPISIRNHELGKRHKDNVAKRLDTMHKEGAAKEKEQQKTAQALQQIEAKAKKSYQKDLAAFQEAGVSSSSNTEQRAIESLKCSITPGSEWEFDTSSGYYYNKSNSFYYDKASDLFYSNSLGKWVSLQEASKSTKITKPDFSNNSSKPTVGPHAPGPVISKPLNPMRGVKGAQSAVALNKRKREDQTKQKPKSKEEEEALKAREAARKRVEAREKPLMGLYRTY